MNDQTNAAIQGIACPHYIFHIYNGAELATAISYKDISQRDLLT